MLNSDSPQGIYAPLSQVMTDSESEEEIHNSIKLPHHNLNHNNLNHNYNHNNRQHPQQFPSQNPIQQQFQQQQYSITNNNNSQPANQRTVPNHLNLSLNHNSGINMSMQNAYRNTINSGGLPRTIHHHGSGSFSSFNSDVEDRQHIDADNVAILGVNEDKSGPMSTIRRICFFLSLMVCVITVILFLWIVPCNDGSACPAQLDRIKTHNWLNNYTRIELKGLVNVVDGIRSWEKNLIFLYRGDAFFPEFKPSNKKRNGIISLISSSGATAWFDETINEPMTIDCTLLDVDKNGKADCLVLDEYGQLGVIDPVFGLWYWTLKNQTSQKIDALDFPMILPDLDGDGVYEILLAGANKGDDKSRNVLQIISGRLGKPIGDGTKISDCDCIRKFQLDQTQTVSFNCVKNNTEAQRSKTINEIYSLITNKSIKQNLSPASKINQHRHYGQRKDTEAQRNIYQLSGKELIIENRGKCPENCNMTFSLTELKDGHINIIRNFTSTGMYGMVPAQWHFKNTKSDISGFVIKFWKWENSTASSNREKRNDDFDFDDSDFFSNNFNTFDRVILKRDGFTITDDTGRVERSIANITKQKSGNNIVWNNYKMQRIKETVVLIIFNGAYTSIENTSQSNIVQFCRNDKSDVNCQPDLNNQENSLLIADLDQDGSQELVSYYTTFISKDDEKKDWELVTYVQLLRLEAELPNLYEGLKHN